MNKSIIKHASLFLILNNYYEKYNSFDEMIELLGTLSNK